MMILVRCSSHSVDRGGIEVTLIGGPLHDKIRWREFHLFSKDDAPSEMMNTNSYDQNLFWNRKLMSEDCVV